MRELHLHKALVELKTKERFQAEFTPELLEARQREIGSDHLPAVDYDDLREAGLVELCREVDTGSMSNLFRAIWDDNSYIVEPYRTRRLVQNWDIKKQSLQLEVLEEENWSTPGKILKLRTPVSGQYQNRHKETFAQLQDLLENAVVAETMDLPEFLEGTRILAKVKQEEELAKTEVDRVDEILEYLREELDMHTSEDILDLPPEAQQSALWELDNNTLDEEDVAYYQECSLIEACNEVSYSTLSRLQDTKREKVVQKWDLMLKNLPGKKLWRIKCNNCGYEYNISGYIPDYCNICEEGDLIWIQYIGPRQIQEVPLWPEMPMGSLHLPAGEEILSEMEALHTRGKLFKRSVLYKRIQAQLITETETLEKIEKGFTRRKKTLESYLQSFTKVIVNNALHYQKDREAAGDKNIVFHRLVPIPNFFINWIQEHPEEVPTYLKKQVFHPYTLQKPHPSGKGQLYLENWNPVTKEVNYKVAYALYEFFWSRVYKGTGDKLRTLHHLYSPLPSRARTQQSIYSIWNRWKVLAALQGVKQVKYRSCVCCGEELLPEQRACPACGENEIEVIKEWKRTGKKQVKGKVRNCKWGEDELLLRNLIKPKMG